MPQAIENGHQRCRAIKSCRRVTAIGGKLNVVWLDFRDDVSGQFDALDQRDLSRSATRWTCRGAQATFQQNGNLTWTSYGILQDRAGTNAPRISKYLTGDYQDPSGNSHLKQLQFNRANLKLYAGGTRPFIGDFIDVAGLAFLTAQQVNQQSDDGTTWVPNDGTNPALSTTAAQTFYAFWTDNRDAKVGVSLPEPTGGESDEGSALPYVAPGHVGVLRRPDRTRRPRPAMPTSTWRGSRRDVFVAAPTNSKPSVNSHGPNPTLPSRCWCRTAPPHRGVSRSRSPISRRILEPRAWRRCSRCRRRFLLPLPAPVLSTDVIVPPNSSTSRAVYVGLEREIPAHQG